MNEYQIKITLNIIILDNKKLDQQSHSNHSSQTEMKQQKRTCKMHEYKSRVIM